jgi:hypothetical protein
MRNESQCFSKARYPDRFEAERVRQKSEARRPVRLRAYRCPHCLGWHLTRRGVEQPTPAAAPSPAAVDQAAATELKRQRRENHKARQREARIRDMKRRTEVERERRWADR